MRSCPGCEITYRALQMMEEQANTIREQAEIIKKQEGQNEDLINMLRMLTAGDVEFNYVDVGDIPLCIPE